MAGSKKQSSDRDVQCTREVDEHRLHALAVRNYTRQGSDLLRHTVDSWMTRESTRAANRWLRCAAL